MASIKQRPDGSWRARYRDEAHREHSRHFATKREAQRWLDEVTTAVVTGRYVNPRAGVMTLGQFYLEWSVRQIWAPTTVTAMNLTIAKCTLRDVALNRISRSHVEGWVKHMSAQGLAPGTIKTRVNNVRNVLRAAVRDRRIPDDPSAGVTLPRKRKLEAAMHIPTSEDVGDVLSAALPHASALIALCAFAGLRLGEAAAVQLEDIDFLRRRIHVRRQVQFVSAGVVNISPPKYGSERTIFAADELLALLSQHVEMFGTHGMAHWLFRGESEQPPHQNTVSYWWRNANSDAGVTPFRLHDLRHFYASGLIAAGCDVVTVQRALGHARATTTLNTYSHLWPTAEDKTREAAGALVASALRTSHRTRASRA